MDNILYYGDNFDILQSHIKDDSVDLIYLDPPFKSNQDYNVLFEEKNGSLSSAQIKAFEDTWKWDQSAAEAYHEVVESGGTLSQTMQAFRKILGENDMMAYLSMMAPRLVEMKRVLKSTGSIFLHCDPTASHYIKLLMDSIFDRNLRNEIIWSYKRYTAVSRQFQRLHDVIFFYSKSRTPKFNELREEYGSKSGKADSHYKKDSKGRWFRWQKRKGKEPYKIFLSEGKRLGDVWDIPIINASARERLGYPAQKPESLLERIILAGSDEGDIVLDPFCGCGTTVAVAQKLKRKWIGIDITHIAITLIKYRLQDTFGKKINYSVIGEPVSLPDAIALAKQDTFQFQMWALGLVGARPMEPKKGADKGIDGRLYFHDNNDDETRQIIFSVKSGHVSVSHIRDLRGVVERESADMGIMITLNDPTTPMIREAASAGFYVSPYAKHPKIQILTIKELLAGLGIDYPKPTQRFDVTFKKATDDKTPRPKTKDLPFKD